MGKRKKVVGVVILGAFLLALAVGAAVFFRTGRRSESQPFQAYCQPVREEDVQVSEDGLYYADSQILLTAAPISSFEEVEDLAASYDGEIVGYISDTADYQLQFPRGTAYPELLSLAETLAADPLAESATVSYVALEEYDSVDYQADPWTATETADSTGSRSAWSTGEPDGLNWWAEALRLPQVWEQDLDLATVKVGIIDSMFDVDHPDLASRFDKTWNNPADEAGNCQVDDLYQDARDHTKQGEQVPSTTLHGTHVAGIIAAEGGNGTGITGISQNARLYGYAMKSDDAGESAAGQWGSVFQYKHALASLLNEGVKIVNISMGCSQAFHEIPQGNPYWITYIDSFNESMSRFLQQYIEEGREFLIVKAAGNEGLDAENDMFSGITEKSVRSRILVVGSATAVTNPYAAFRASSSNTGSRVNLYAPGAPILSTLPGGGCGEKSGTSMAAPMVSGLCSLIWGVNPDLTADQVTSILMQSRLANWFQDESVPGILTLIGVEELVPLPDALFCVDLSENEDTREQLEAEGQPATVMGVLYSGEAGTAGLLELESFTIRSEPDGTDAGSPDISDLTYLDFDSSDTAAGTHSLLHYSTLLSPGDYSIEVKARGCEALRQSFSVTAGQVLILDFCLQPDRELFASALPEGADFSLQVSGKMSTYWPEGTTAGSTSSVSRELSAVVRRYGTDSMSASAQGHLSVSTTLPAEGTTQATEFAYQHRYENGVLQRSYTLPAASASQAQRTPLEYLDLGLPDEECWDSLTLHTDGDGNLLYTLTLKADTLTEENAHILLHVLDENYRVNWTENPAYGWGAGFDEASLLITLDTDGKLLSIQADYVVNAAVQDVFKASGSTLFTFGAAPAVDLAAGSGWWLQQDASNPFLLAFGADGSLTYYATVTRESDYFSSYSLEGDTLWLELVNLDVSGVTTVPYQVTADGENTMTLSLDESQAPQDRALLDGMESLMAGTYRRLWFSSAQLETIKTSLGVPAGRTVEVQQGTPYYWDAGARWLIQVSIYEGGNFVAGAAFDAVTLEMCTGIYMYAG